MTDKYIEKNLIVVNGLSDSGKTSLCMHLVNQYKFNYYKVKNHFDDLKLYHEHILDLVWKDMKEYNSNWIIEGLHLNNAIIKLPIYDVKEFDNKIVDYCKENNIVYSLIQCLPTKEELSEREQNSVDTYEQYKEDLNIYKYDFTVDSDYLKIDEYIERR